MKRPQADQLFGYTIRGYKVEELLGVGQLTAVYRVRNQLGETRMLTLFIQPERFTEEVRERFLMRFDLQAPALSSLKHQHLVPLDGWGQQAGYPYLLLPDMTGRTVALELRGGGPFSLPYAIAILERVAEGLDFAHERGVLHLGLSSTRIFVVEDTFVQIAGFGLTALLQRHGIEDSPNDPYGHLRTIAGTFLGSAAYLAPEVVQGAVSTARTDVYALGILLYEMLCGHPPFRGETYLETAHMHVTHPLPPLHARCKDVPLALELVLHQALKRDPRQRFEHPRDLAAACMRVVTRRPFTLVSMSREHGSPVTAFASRDSSPPVNTEPRSPAHHPSLREQEGKRMADRQTGLEKAVQSKSTNVASTRSYSPPSKNGRTGKGVNPTHEEIVALFDALERVPRPSYEGADARALVPVPLTETPSPLQDTMGEFLGELFPQASKASIQKSRRRFQDMFH